MSHLPIAPHGSPYPTARRRPMPRRRPRPSLPPRLKQKKPPRFAMAVGFTGSDWMIHIRNGPLFGENNMNMWMPMTIIYNYVVIAVRSWPDSWTDTQRFPPFQGGGKVENNPNKTGESMWTSSSKQKCFLGVISDFRGVYEQSRGDIAASQSQCQYCSHVIFCVWLGSLGTRSSMPVRCILEECVLRFVLPLSIDWVQHQRRSFTKFKVSTGLFIFLELSCSTVALLWFRQAWYQQRSLSFQHISIIFLTKFGSFLSHVPMFYFLTRPRNRPPRLPARLRKSWRSRRCHECWAPWGFPE
jgi:hypothetical protein